MNTSIHIDPENGSKKFKKNVTLTIQAHQAIRFLEFFLILNLFTIMSTLQPKNFDLVPKLMIFLPCTGSSKLTFRYKHFFAENFFFILNAKNQREFY